MENYICINGKRAELTEEQLKALGIELPKVNPFQRVAKQRPFYFITYRGNVEYGVEITDFYCESLYNVANYCTDKKLIEQRALHETLNRLLWRYSMEHNGDKINPNAFYMIRYKENLSEVYCTSCSYVGDTKFYSREIAKAAIKEIIEPFMKAHPDFKF